MSRNVTFYLGPAVGLAGRKLVITKMLVATDKLTRPAPYWSSDSSTLTNTATYVTVLLPDNYLFQAVLQDQKSTGEYSRVDVLNFHTGTLQFPGPKSLDRLQIYSMEDLSSLSSASSLSSSSSSSSKSSVTSSSSRSSVTSSSSRSSLSSSSSSSVTSSSSKSSVTSSSSKSSVTSSSSNTSSNSSSSLSSLSSSSSSSSSFHAPG